MAKKQELVRDYRMGDGTLQQLGDAYIDLLDRDSAELAPYGVVAATTTDLQDKIDAFAAHPTDEYYLGKVVLATNDKITKRDIVETAIRGIHVRFVSKYGLGHGNLTLLGVGAISKEIDDTLHRTAQTVSLVTTELQAELATQGIDAAFITDYNAKVLAFNNAIDKQAKAIRERDVATNLRAELGNALYKDIVNISSFGKDAFYGTNEAKYNDYLVTEQANELGQQRTGSLNNGEKAHLDFTGVDADDTFRIVIPAGSKIGLYCSDTTTGDPVGSPLNLNGPAEELRSAAQLGWTELTPFLIARNSDGPSPSLYEVYRVG